VEGQKSATEPAPNTARQLSETLDACDRTKEECLGILTMYPTVLVVEDDETLRSLTADAISLLDVIVIDCANADDALPKLEGSSSIALVMTDICMPGSMDGLQLAQVIWVRWPLLPVILTSGNRSIPDGMLPSHCFFLRKPWSLNALHQAVRSCLPACD
jgi:DNA-binding NtrC family response regulator